MRSATLGSVCALTQNWRRKYSLCASSSPWTKNARSNPGVPRCDSHRHGRALSLLQLAIRLTHRATGDVDALASSGLPLILALEIQARSTPSASRPPGVDSAHGSGKPDVGTGAYWDPQEGRCDKTP